MTTPNAAAVLEDCEANLSALFESGDWRIGDDVMQQGMSILEDLRAELATLRASLTQQGGYLCENHRFKLAFDSKGRVGALCHFAKELDGRWVALVAAEDDAHMRTLSPPQYDGSHVGIEERPDLWPAWVHRVVESVTAVTHPAAVDERLAEAIIAGIGNIPYQTLTVEDVIREVTAALQPADDSEGEKA